MADEMIEVQACPFCGGFNIYRNMVEWEAHSLDTTDPHNTAILGEHQCADCARSFWS